MSLWVIASILSPLEHLFRHILDWIHTTIGQEAS